MEPNALQKQALIRNAGCRRFVWNWALNECQQHYLESGTILGDAELSRRLTALKHDSDHAWLLDANAASLQQALIDLHRAYKRFFARHSKFPTFKSKKRDALRFRIPENVEVVDGHVSIPKLGMIRIRQSREVEGLTKSATFKRDACGHWDVLLVSEFELPETPVPTAEGHAIGVGFAAGSFALFSNGTSIPIPPFVKAVVNRLTRAARAVKRTQARSHGRLHATQRLARIKLRAEHQRADFVHKITTDLVRNNETICIEDSLTKSFAKTKLARDVLDAGLAEFKRQVVYKAAWLRRHLALVPSRGDDVGNPLRILREGLRDIRGRPGMLGDVKLLAERS